MKINKKGIVRMHFQKNIFLIFSISINLFMVSIADDVSIKDDHNSKKNSQKNTG